ncbi:MAG: type II toxin-antitoxin system PemK/MazF family toxin [Alphaproteobacteria bacterium]|nr:type II toxin-antitoxin system PemK/MazF family toxin [Alphaproteobacteria bacterium]
MTRLAKGDVIWVAFPFVEQGQLKSRPALVLNFADIGDGLCWAAMITGAGKAAWPGDVPIADHHACGLPIASIIRTAKLATLNAAAAQRIGAVPPATLIAVDAWLRTKLGL